MKFNIGDIVKSKQTGIPVIGKIVQIVDPICFTMAEQGGKRFHRWDDLYSDWRVKLIYGVLFPQAQRILTLEEYKNIRIATSNTIFNYSDDEWKHIYEESISETIMASYPEDDLELYYSEYSGSV